MVCPPDSRSCGSRKGPGREQAVPSVLTGRLGLHGRPHGDPALCRPAVPTPLGVDGPGAEPLRLLSLSCPERSLISGRGTSGPIPMRAFPRGCEGTSRLAGQRSSKEPSQAPRNRVSSVTGRAGAGSVLGLMPTAPGGLAQRLGPLPRRRKYRTSGVDTVRETLTTEPRLQPRESRLHGKTTCPP